jgi:hypothetical protein
MTGNKVIEKLRRKFAADKKITEEICRHVKFVPDGINSWRIVWAGEVDK